MAQNSQISPNLQDQKVPVQKAGNGLFNAGNLIILAAVFLAAKFFLALALPRNNLIFASDLAPDNILKAVNEQRSLRNLAALNVNGKLSFAGQGKADDMQARHYFAHVDPAGHYIWDRIVAAGYSPYIQLGENLAIEFYDTDSLISAWMNSPTHRANILQEGFKDDGLSLAFGQSGQGQYHSAVVNAFGALAPAPRPKKTVAAPPPPKISIKPPAQPAPPQPAPAPGPAASPTKPQPAGPGPQPHPPTAPIVPPKGTETLAVNPGANFYFAPKTQTAPTAAPPAQTGNQIPVPAAVIGKKAAVSEYDSNRYLILFAGIILLFLALSDIKQAAEKKLAHVDKKINNLVVLVIALAVIAFMYWL